MPDSRYILSRDLKNPMELIKEKACTRCGTVKPNTFVYFPHQVWRTRGESTTAGVCSACKGSRLKAAHKARREERTAYEEHKIQETLRKFKQGGIEKAARDAEEALKGQVGPDPERKLSDPG